MKSVNEIKKGSRSKPGIWLTVMLVIMGAYPPLSTDMYLPAMKEMASIFNTTESMVNVTLMVFFIFYSISTLLWGSISDKYGRKPALFTGLMVYIAGSLICAFSNTIEMMIAGRVIQALGAGAPTTIGIAIVQDLYGGESKKRVLAVLTALMMIAPVVAPVLGSAIITEFGWRWIFGVLAFIGMISVLFLLFFEESIPFKKDESVLQSLGGLFRVMSNPMFRKLLIIFSSVSIIVLGFVGGSSMILRTGYGVSSSQFSMYFASNAVFAIIGAMLFVPFSKVFRTRIHVAICFSVITLSGAMIISLGHSGPSIFIASLIPATLCGAMLRPLGVNILLEAGSRETGAVSSLINFFFMVLGSIGVFIVSLKWSDLITTFGIMVLAVGLFAVTSWFIIGKEKLMPGSERCGSNC